MTPRAAARQAPLSMGFSRQEHWSGLPFPPPGDLPDPGIEPRSPAWQADSLPSELSNNSPLDHWPLKSECQSKSGLPESRFGFAGLSRTGGLAGPRVPEFPSPVFPPGRGHLYGSLHSGAWALVLGFSVWVGRFFIEGALCQAQVQASHQHFLRALPAIQGRQAGGCSALGNRGGRWN